MIRPMIRSMIRSMRSSIIPVASRYFMYLDGSSSYYSIDSTINLNGNLSLDYYSKTTGTAMNFCDGFGIDALGNFVSPPSVTDIILDGVSVGTGATAPLDALYHNVEFVGASGVNITVIGQSGSLTNYFDGVIADIDIDGIVFEIKEGSSNTESSLDGSRAITYVSVSNRQEFEPESDDWIGAQEIWDDSNLIGLTADWSSSTPNIYDLNGSSGTLLRPGGDPITEYVRVSFEYVQISGNMRVGNTGIFTVTSSGDYTVAGDDASAIGFKRNSGSVTGQLRFPSVKLFLERP